MRGRSACSRIGAGAMGMSQTHSHLVQGERLVDRSRDARFRAKRERKPECHDSQEYRPFFIGLELPPLMVPA